MQKTTAWKGLYCVCVYVCVYNVQHFIIDH